MSKKFYVIWKGAQTGIFTTWPDVQQHTAGRSDAQYMGFESKAAAEQAFTSTYTKALMQRSLSKSGTGTAAPTSTRKTTSKTSEKIASTKTSAISPNGPSDIEIYCDGACSPNPGKSGTGLAVYESGKVTSLYYGLYLPNGTNNTAELSGLLSAFQIAQHFIDKNSEQSICILSDSKYSIDSITKWASGWQKKGWTRGKGEEIKNLALIQQCYALYKTMHTKVTVRHVKAHSNIEGNELADRMAVIARKQHQENMIRYSETINIKALLAMDSG
jgi:ribonuclease HI